MADNKKKTANYACTTNVMLSMANMITTVTHQKQWL